MKWVIVALLFFVHATVVASDFENHLSEAMSLLTHNQHKDAEVMLLALEKEQPQNPDVIYGLAICALSNKEYKKSAELCEKAIDIKKDARYYYILGAANGMIAQNSNIFKQIGFIKKIRGAFEEACRLDPKYIEPRMALVQYYLIAPGIAGGSIKEALRYADEIEKIDKLQGHYARTSIYSHENQFKELLEEYKKITALDPKSYNPYTGMVNCYIGLKDGQNAFATIANAEKLFPEQKLLWMYQKGKISAECGIELETGESALKEYVTKKLNNSLPQPSYAYWRLGMIEENKKNKDAAIEHYKTALRLDKNNRYAKQAMDKLTKVTEKRSGR